MFKLIDFKVRGDEKGWLVALEGARDIPFDIKRVFYIYETQNHIVRGCHANRKSQFVLVCVAGSCRVKVMRPQGDDVFVLDTPSKGLWLDKMVWKDMYDFSEDCVLLVFSDQAYDASEYVTDFEEYMREMKHAASAG